MSQMIKNEMSLETSESDAVPYTPASVDDVVVWSSNGEEFSAVSFEEFLENDDGLMPGNKVYFGNPDETKTSQLCDAEDVLNMMANRADDLVGEFSDGYPNVSDAAHEELDALLASWINKHCPPSFYRVKNVQSRILTKQDFPEGHPALEHEGGAA